MSFFFFNINIVGKYDNGILSIFSRNLRKVSNANDYQQNVFMELGVSVANNKQTKFLKWLDQRINVYIHCYSH